MSNPLSGVGVYRYHVKLSHPVKGFNLSISFRGWNAIPPYFSVCTTNYLMISVGISGMRGWRPYKLGMGWLSVSDMMPVGRTVGVIFNLDDTTAVDPRCKINRPDWGVLFSCDTTRVIMGCGSRQQYYKVPRGMRLAIFSVCTHNSTKINERIEGLTFARDKTHWYTTHKWIRVGSGGEV